MAIFHDDYGIRPLPVLGAVFLVIFAFGWGIVTLGNQHGWFIDHNAVACESSGGVVKSSSKNTVAVGPKGQPVVGIATTYFCILDGDVTDIW